MKFLVVAFVGALLSAIMMLFGAGSAVASASCPGDSVYRSGVCYEVNDDGTLGKAVKVVG